VASGSLAAGAMTGLPAGLLQALAIYGLNTPDDRYADLLIVIMMATTFLFAVPAGVAAAWLRSGTEDPAELREARIRQDCSRPARSRAAGLFVRSGS
jgi:hypothetical protein